MSFDTQFRKELKSMLSLSSQNHSTMSEKEEKHVSWVSVETDENKNKKAPLSTPYPRRRSSKEDIVIKPTVLSFNDCLSSMEDIEKPKRKRKASTGEYMDFKKKLSQKTVSSGLNSGWLESDVSSPLVRNDSDISNEDIVVSEIDPNGVLAKEILKKIKENNIYNDLSTTDESLPNESFTHSEFDQIELLNGDCFDSGTSIFYSDSSSSEDETLYIPKIVKNAKRFKAQCQIVQPEGIFGLQNTDVDASVKDFVYKDKITKPSAVEKKKPAPSTKPTKILEMPKENQQIKNAPIVNQEEDVSSESGSSDTEFLLDYEDNLNNTKDFSFVMPSAEKKINDSISECVQFYISRKHSILLLTNSTKLYFCGKLSITILSGAIEVLGHVFESNTKDIELFSPKGQSYLYVSTVERERNENLENLLSSYNIKIPTKDLDSVSVLLVKNLENNLTRSLNNHSPKLLFPKVSTNDEERSLSLLETRLQSYFELEPLSWPVLVIEEDWASLYNSLNFGKKISIMACGGKGVGKSTFLKYITNKLLQTFEKVVYIDLDPGQPEFTISGCISTTIVDKPLLGPNYTHLKKPERCHFLGEINISHCFTRYISSVKDLISHYRTKIDPTIPCVINYMGFTKSLGTDLINTILPIVSPSILVQIESDNRKHNFPALLTTDFITRRSNTLPVETETQNLNYELKVLKSVTSKTDRSSALEPKVLRNMCTVAYFSQALKTGNAPIAGVTPYCASLSSLTIQHVSEADDNMLPVINGTLVALCTESSNDCLGFGFVRGIDTTSDKIYIITPEPSEVMKKVRTLVMGFITIPSSFYTTAGFHEGGYPYICRTVRRDTTSIPKRAYRACQGLLKK